MRGRCEPGARATKPERGWRGPVSLLLHARHRLDRVEELVSLRRVLDVGVDEQAVRFRVDVLHRDLEAVEAARLRQLDFGREALAEVLVDNAIRRGEESENVFDEVLLVLAQLLPVGHVVLRWQVRARR